MTDQPKTYTARVAIVGSRDYPDLEEVLAFVRGLDPGTLVISGGAQGVDLTAEHEADRLGFDVLEFEPDYERYGPQRAPLERNTLIVEAADRIVAFQTACKRCGPTSCPYNGMSHGTGDTVRKALRARKRVSLKHPGRAWQEYDA